MHLKWLCLNCYNGYGEGSDRTVEQSCNSIGEELSQLHTGTDHASRRTDHASRRTDHASRRTDHASRCQSTKTF